jgi:hypothetical protein
MTINIVNFRFFTWNDLKNGKFPCTFTDFAEEIFLASLLYKAKEEGERPIRQYWH